MARDEMEFSGDFDDDLEDDASGFAVNNNGFVKELDQNPLPEEDSNFNDDTFPSFSGFGGSTD